MSQEHISLSNNLWQENLEVSLSAFQLLTERLVIQAHPGMRQICHTLTVRGWRIRNSLISLPLASIGSDKVQLSLPPGTLFLLAENIDLMATQATKFNKNRVQIT